MMLDVLLTLFRPAMTTNFNFLFKPEAASSGS